MVDATDPNVLALLTQKAKEANTTVQALLDTIKKSGISLDQYYTMAKNAAVGISNFSNVTQNAANNVDGFKNIVDYVRQSMVGLNKDNGAAILNFAKLGGAAALLTTNFFSINDVMGQFDSSLSSSDISARRLTGQLAVILNEIPIIGQKLAAAATKFIEASTSANAFENALLEAATAGGNLYNSIQEDAGSLATNLTGFSAKIAEESAFSANILGISFSDAIKRTITVLKTLPGEYGKVYEAIDNIGAGAAPKTFTAMELLSRTARGTGRSFETAMNIASESLGLFGMGADKSAERLAVLSKASSSLKMPFEDVHGLVSGIDQQFKFWGSQLDSTISILGRLSSALKDSGVGFKGQIDLVRSLSQGIAQMPLQMKAFIASMSGLKAPGGMVGGGLQVELLMQDKSGAGMAKILGMLQQTLETKTGVGRTLTLQEAATSPNLQQAFLTQRGLLQQMTGISDTGMLNRLMEAMSKSALGGAGTIDAQRALTEALDSGRELAESQTNIAAQHFEVAKQQAALLHSINLNIKGRETFGTTRDEYGRTEMDIVGLERDKWLATKRTAAMYTPEEIDYATGKSSVRVVTKGLESTKKIIKGVEGVGGDLLGGGAAGKNIDAAMKELSTLESKKEKTAEDKKKIEDLKKFIKNTSKGGLSEWFEEQYGKAVEPLYKAIEEEPPIAPSRTERGAGLSTRPFTGRAAVPLTPTGGAMAPVKFEPIDVKITVVGPGGEVLTQLVQKLNDLTDKVKKVTAGSSTT